MEFIIGIAQAMGISLGVGSSTLAVLNFFHAIADGKIDETERNFMGVTYTVLRVSMGIILVTSLILAFLGYQASGYEYFTNYIVIQSILVAILFINAFLMTLRIMPSTFGPAIQASAWYSLGFLSALTAQYLVNIKLVSFFLGYITLFLLFVSIINGVMAYLKEKRQNQQNQLV